ncbi:MAG: putative AAA+ superfamily ATPase [Saprospiraceae bacterium]|jgi:predicted AAA+ superfamily ATPase
MKEIKRSIHALFAKKMQDRKIIILTGPRQVGKTSFLKTYFKDQSVIWFNADEADIRQRFANQNLTFIKQLIGDHKIMVIDEAQRISDIGLLLKIIYDNLTEVKVVVTGSSSLELANSINEPLTGRKWEINMYPISTYEMIEHTSLLEEQRLLEHRLIYGSYPDVINNPGQESELLKELADSYLYKDILTWEDIKKPQTLEKLVQALAFQIGSEFSYNELGQMTGLNHETVQRYMYLLEKAFILFQLPSYSKNLRNELKKSKKVYFYDLGIRNAVIKNFNPINLRNDKGALWENYLIIERLKQKSYYRLHSNDYFWRTHAQQEIDFIEDYNGLLHAFEFKWNPNKKIKFSKSFSNAYPDSIRTGVTTDNYLQFLNGGIEK